MNGKTAKLIHNYSRVTRIPESQIKSAYKLAVTNNLRNRALSLMKKVTEHDRHQSQT